MKEKPTSVMTSAPTETAVEQAVLEALAVVREQPVAAVRDSLVAAGPEMPLDSLETVEIMLELEEQFGVRFPDDAETCAAFQSVRTLVTLVRRLASSS